MPLLIAFGVGALVGGAGGFVAGDGVEGVSRLGRWAVIGGAVYLGGKVAKVW
ncbi:MAG: hypothetical protein ACFB13_21180 [Kiloniellaceae bacterium]